mmetsp:Transcript_107515/g.342829  ORF Transcript_107515/g.342829 Transcript_107515/m.342829 type:complete len:467 (-) Transcript_107515:6937-8337(-)
MAQAELGREKLHEPRLALQVRVLVDQEVAQTLARAETRGLVAQCACEQVPQHRQHACHLRALAAGGVQLLPQLVRELCAVGREHARQQHATAIGRANARGTFGWARELRLSGQEQDAEVRERGLLSDERRQACVQAIALDHGDVAEVLEQQDRAVLAVAAPRGGGTRGTRGAAGGGGGGQRGRGPDAHGDEEAHGLLEEAQEAHHLLARVELDAHGLPEGAGERGRLGEDALEGREGAAGAGFTCIQVVPDVQSQSSLAGEHAARNSGLQALQVVYQSCIGPPTQRLIRKLEEQRQQIPVPVVRQQTPPQDVRRHLSADSQSRIVLHHGRRIRHRRVYNRGFADLRGSAPRSNDYLPQLGQLLADLVVTAHQVVEDLNGAEPRRVGQRSWRVRRQREVQRCRSGHWIALRLGTPAGAGSRKVDAAIVSEERVALAFEQVGELRQNGVERIAKVLKCLRRGFSVLCR